MITRTEIEQLASYENPATPVISFYLNIDKGRPDEASWNIRLKNLLSKLEERRSEWSEAEWASVTADMERIRAYVRDQRVAGARGVAIFASSAGDFWQTYAFPNRVGNEVRLTHSTYVRPLFRTLDRFQPQCVALVSKDQGRIFLLFGDTEQTIEERADLVSDVPGRHDQGGRAQARLQRHHDDAVRQHLKKTAELVFKVFRETPFERLLIAGTDPVAAEFQDALHPYVRERILGTFNIPMSASPKIVQDRARPILRAMDAQRQQDMVDLLAAEVAERDLGAVGLAPSLDALRQGQVQTLLVIEDYDAPGQRCTACGALLTQGHAACPLCGGALMEVEDLVSSMVEQAMEQGARVLTVTAPGAVARLESLGHVGAILRFAVAPETTTTPAGP